MPAIFRRVARGPVPLLILALASGPWLQGPAGAQEPGAVLEGRLYLGDAPADSGTVVLHRVTPEEAGPLDSLRVDREGRFRFHLPSTPLPGSGEVFFVSARRQGILYYGEPLVTPEQLEEEYRVRVHPARPIPPVGIPVPVVSRSLFLEAGPVGWRITDLFEIRNDSAVTWTAGEGAAFVWRHPLPPGAHAFRVGSSEVGPDAVAFRDGGVEFRGPFIPGDRLLIIHYDVEALEFSLPLPGRTDFVEVLVRDPAPPLVMEGLTSRPAVAVEEDSRYDRWTGEDLRDRVIRIREGSEPPASLPGWVAVVVALALALFGIGLVVARESRR
jgi:hypothetical protein